MRTTKEIILEALNAAYDCGAISTDEHIQASAEAEYDIIFPKKED